MWPVFASEPLAAIVVHFYLESDFSGEIAVSKGFEGVGSRDFFASETRTTSPWRAFCRPVR